MKRLNMNNVYTAFVIIVIIAMASYAGYMALGKMAKTNAVTLPAVTMKEQLEQEMTMEPTPVPEAADKLLSTDELLPKLSEEADDFVKQNPVAKMLKEQNFLVSGYHVGINTVLQSHKIPYHDLRSSPAISKSVVSPWNNSYVEAPAGSSTRRQFEIGSA